MRIKWPPRLEITRNEIKLAVGCFFEIFSRALARPTEGGKRSKWVHDHEPYEATKKKLEEKAKKKMEKMNLLKTANGSTSAKSMYKN
jgi:hypothetical protein